MTFLARSTRLAAAIAIATVVSSCGGGGDGITVGTNVTGVRFVAQPAGAGAGVAFTVSVELIGSNGNRATGATDPVTLTINNGATITGTAVAASVEGLATFTGISIAQIGTGYLLTATAKGFTTQSASFSITDPCTIVALNFPGSANGTVGTGGCTTGATGFPAAVYRFTANTTNANTFAVTSSFNTPAIEVRNDPPGLSVGWRAPSTTPTSVDMDWLLPAGTYLIRVSTRTTAGTFTLTGSLSSFNSNGCEYRSFVTSITVTQVLANTDCALNDGTFYDKFVIQSTRACTISMTSPTMRSYAVLADGLTGNVFDEEDSGQNGGTATFSLPAGCNSGGGPLEIWANTLVSQTGNYTLTVTLSGPGNAVASPFAVPSVPLEAYTPGGRPPVMLRKASTGDLPR